MKYKMLVISLMFCASSVLAYPDDEECSSDFVSGSQTPSSNKAENLGKSDIDPESAAIFHDKSFLKKLHTAKSKGQAMSMWMSGNNNKIPRSFGKKKSESTADEWLQYMLYLAMAKYAATAIECTMDPLKNEYMSQLLPEQKAAVVQWHVDRQVEYFVDSGASLSRWMSAHGNQLPKGLGKRKENATEEEWAEYLLYKIMVKYAATEEECAQDVGKRQFMSQLLPLQKDRVLEWHRDRLKMYGSQYGRETSRWMSSHDNRIPRSLTNMKKKKSGISSEEQIEFLIYKMMFIYAGTELECEEDIAKKAYMAELMPEQKIIVSDWHKKRARDGILVLGKKLSIWMSIHDNITPKPTALRKLDATLEEWEAQKLYQNMAKYAGTDEECQRDPKKKIFMEPLTAEQKLAVITWHLHRRRN